ncbi:hypothetical protein EPH_0068000 [Eimeria praecox]|uniref:Protein kinase domain-containing protein n=1 Tax=Eimeria praecox TaxID=51316 RepID=U6H2V9_9EIME|nr:hypothetical protein EPH_0068000 [Eimeria praecox]
MQRCRLAAVVGYFGWNLELSAEDIATKDKYFVNIPVSDSKGFPMYSEDVFDREMWRAAEDEKNAALQACGCVPAELAASQKGMCIPVFTGEISGLDKIHSVGGTRIYGTVGLTVPVLGDLRFLRERIGELDEKARDYMAYRLLLMALKLEDSGVAHLQFDWNSLFLREDGSFLLGNFASAAPFGDEVTSIASGMTKHPEPRLMVDFSETGIARAKGKVNMWNLGILLFHLYTGNQDPYGPLRGGEWHKEAIMLSSRLVEDGVRSNVLIPELEASKVPRRWVELIVRLLEPTSSHRISGFQVVREFPDLINQQAE